MRRLNGLVTALLILLSVAGIGLAALFLRHENQLAAGRQEKMRNLTEQLQPVNAKRKELQDKDKEWQKTLENEKEGKPCVILCFNTMKDDVYYTMYDMMEQYGFRGTFVLQDGNLPGYSEESVTGEEVSEMLNDGWEFAIAENMDSKKETEDDLSFLTAEKETETEADGEETMEEESPQSWLDLVDAHLAAVENSQWEMPVTVLCTQEQYEQTSDAKLAQRGFQMACVLNEEEFPTVGEKGENLWRMDAGLYTQKDLKLEESIQNAVANKKSMVVSINEVAKISEDSGYDLSVTKFTSLLNTLKNLEEQGEIYVLTFSEFYQYGEQQAQAYEELAAQYAKFRQDMLQQIEELDQQEQEIVDSLQNEETEEEGIWGLL